MSEIKIADGTFVYQINAEGSNKWFFGIQPGLDDNNNRTSDEELASVAAKMAAVDDLCEALELCVDSLEYHGRYSLVDKALAALAKARGEQQ